MPPFVKQSLGVAIRGQEAILVAHERIAGRIRYRGSASVPVPQAPENGVAADAAALPKTLRLRGRPDEVVIGLPRSCVVLRILDFPRVDEKDLPGLLAYELERHLPFSVEEACYAFQQLRREQGTITVLIAAVKRADLERHLETVGRLGLRPTAVDVSALAAANAVLHTRKDANGAGMCLIEHHDGQVEVSLVRRGGLVSSRAIALPADALAPLLDEVRRIAAQCGEAGVTVLLSGSRADIGWRIAGETGLTVEPWNAEFAAVEASVYGLALRGLTHTAVQLDLLPPERRLRKREPAVSVMYGLLALLAVAGTSLGFSTAYRERTQLRILDDRLGVVKAQAEAVQALKGEVTNLRARLHTLEMMERERGQTLRVLKDLVQLLPTDVALTDITLEGRKLQIRGTAGASASGLISAFEKSALFENAAFTSPIAAQGNDRQRFQLQAFVKESGQRPSTDGRPPGGRKKP
jgi:Tfp pilus assembly protein PilN